MTAPWQYRDPLETKLGAEVSAQTLMDHVRAIAGWERESGSPGEAQAFDYIERALQAYGLDIERREIETVLGADGERLPARLASGPLRATLTTRVRTGWTPIPHLIGSLPGRVEERFVLFSGHVDAWHYGAMDNAAANATMLEIARLLAERRDTLRRGIRSDLQRARELDALEPSSDAFKFACVAVRRELNRAVHALDSAVSVVTELLEDRR